VSDETRTDRSRWELIVDLLDAYSLWVGLGGFVLTIGMIVVIATRGVPSVPRYWRVFLVAAVACAALGYPAVVKVLRFLYDPPKRFLVQPAVSDEAGGIWELSPADFEDLTVTNGQLYQWPETKHPTYGVEWYDRDSNVCKGTWRGSASESELLESQEKIDEIRENLDKKAKQRDILLIRGQTLVRESVFDLVDLVVNEYNRASIVDVSGLMNKFNEAMDEYDLSDALNEESDKKTEPETATDPETVNQPSRSPTAAADGGEVSDGQ